MPHKLILLLGLMVVLAACAGSKKTGSQGSGQGLDYNTITHEEIVKALAQRPIQNVFELIEFLRPRYLTPRIQNTVTQGAIRKEPVVYLNNARFGGIGELYNINILQVEEIHYLKSYEATQRFGIGHAGGAIIISTR